MSILRGFWIKLATRGSTCAIEIVAIDYLLSVRAELFETHDCSSNDLQGTMLVPSGSGKQTGLESMGPRTVSGDSLGMGTSQGWTTCNPRAFSKASKSR